jgi:hypothetical protein
MKSDIYMLGRQHYYEGLPASAMQHAEPGAQISWLSGWLNAQLECKVIRKKARRLNNAVRMEQR